MYYTSFHFFLTHGLSANIMKIKKNTLNKGRKCSQTTNWNAKRAATAT